MHIFYTIMYKNIMYIMYIKVEEKNYLLQNFKSILPQVSCKRRASVKRPSSYIILVGKNDFHKDFH